MLAIRLPVEIEERLDNLAKTTGRTKTYYAREAILEYIDDMENRYLAEQNTTNFKKNKTKSLNKVLEDYK